MRTYNDDLYHYGVLGMRWGVRHNRSYKAAKKAAKKRLRESGKTDKDKAQYKKDIYDAKVKTANKLYSKQNKKANESIVTASTGKTLVKTMLLGSYGSLKYEEAKAKGTGKGEAIVKGLISNAVDNTLLKVPSTLEYLDNREARKN